MHPFIIRAKKKVVNSQKELESTIEEVRKICKHNMICEVDYQPNKYVETFPPRRMCLDCGLEEEGWGCGWKKLVEKDRTLIKAETREEFYGYRV